jgi:hypothetical protein
MKIDLRRLTTESEARGGNYQGWFVFRNRRESADGLVDITSPSKLYCGKSFRCLVFFKTSAVNITAFLTSVLASSDSSPSTVSMLSKHICSFRLGISSTSSS